MEFSKPVIASVSGWDVAGGLELALMCDIRVVEENARLGVLCRRFGVPLIDGGTVRYSCCYRVTIISRTWVGMTLILAIPLSAQFC